jgi:acetyl esterase
MLKRRGISIVTVLSIFFSNLIYAQSAWLSTAESVNDFRQQVESFKPNPSKITVSSIENMTVDLGDRKINISVYNPGIAEPVQTLIYVHGACWVAGSLDSHDEVSRHLAKESESKVIAIDYRLAPEFKYPAAPNDRF